MATTKKAASSTRTKKTASTRKKAAPKSSASATKVTRVSAKSTSTPSVAATSKRPRVRLDGNMLNIVIAELVGTFILTMVALLTFQSIMPLYVGLTLVVLVLAIGAVSGSHVNPAVTFGLWAAGKLKALMLPFYWAAQLLGAMAAVAVLNIVSANDFGLDFGHFNTFSWDIFTVELVGTAVFLFGLVAVINRTELSNVGRALGIGMSLMLGLLVASSLYAPAYQSAVSDYSQARSNVKDGDEKPAIPHTAYVKGATLNPAVALAATESTDSELGVPSGEENERRYTRLGWEVILSTLIGAALGANLARLLSYRFRV